jgi:Cellulase (glycosyl hydrolase family 5)
MKRKIASSLTAIALMVSASDAQAKTDSLPVGRCVNMGNSLEPPTENAWGGSKISDRDFQIIAKAGFNSVRIPVRWSTHAANKPPYTIDAAYMARVKQVVGGARNAGLNVILNSHHFEEIHSDPSAANIAKLAGMWTQIAAAFAGEPRENLWFEIENEPHEKFNDSNLLLVLNPALAEIRKTNPDRPVIIGGEFWSGIKSLSTLKLPDDPNIVPTFHYYDPFLFTHQGATWINPVPPMGRVFGSEADIATLNADVQMIRDYIKRTGKTPFMGEFGANEKISVPERVQYQRTVRKAFDAVGIGMCAWGFTNTFPLYDHTKKAWVPGMRDAMGLSEPDYKEDDMKLKAIMPAALLPLASVASAAQPTPELQALDDATPGALINDPSRLDWDVFGPGATHKPVKSADIPSGAALQVTIPKAGNTLYEIGTNAPITQAIKKGTDITVMFYARTVKAATPDGKGLIGVRFQQNAAPYPGFGETSRVIGTEWKAYEVTAKADRDIPKGQAVVGFQLSGAKQTIEIGQTIIVAGTTSILSKNSTSANAVTTDLLPQLVGKGALINNPADKAWAVYGKGETHSQVPAKNIPGTGGTALQMNIGAPSTAPYEIGASVPITQSIAKGDVILLGVLARSVSASTPDGLGKIGVRVQVNEGTYPGFADNSFAVGPNWKLFQIRSQATMDIPAGKGVVGLHFGAAAQVVEIGQVFVINTSVPAPLPVSAN